jgi:hypothetical protein
MLRFFFGFKSQTDKPDKTNIAIEITRHIFARCRYISEWSLGGASDAQAAPIPPFRNINPPATSKANSNHRRMGRNTKSLSLKNQRLPVSALLAIDLLR